MPTLKKIALENFRCFSARQEACLAPVTFLVGSNSTGKTSFLALLRALWNTVFLEDEADFNKAPYNLGTFYDIISSTGHGTRHEDGFRTDLWFVPNPESSHEIQCSMKFHDRGGIPIPILRKFSSNSVWIELDYSDSTSHWIRCGTESSSWNVDLEIPPISRNKVELIPMHHVWFSLSRSNFGIKQADPPVSVSQTDVNRLKHLLSVLIDFLLVDQSEPFASAPVRSRPRRTYDLGRPSTDPEGENIPTYLARMKSQNREDWTALKRKLEFFGRELGLFDQVMVNTLKRGAGGPFQIEIKRRGINKTYPSRNLIDVGYGVSQVLPLLTELLRDNVPDLCLLQQPEVHLHPSAQAALGTLFAEVCSERRQLIIETHSDYLINRVRMDIRDGTCKIDENDVSILFFEPVGDSVKIHSIRIDKMGNVLGAPPSYRRFFTDETDREVQF